jgi:hypothetical protein
VVVVRPGEPGKSTENLVRQAMHSDYGDYRTAPHPQSHQIVSDL